MKSLEENYLSVVIVLRNCEKTVVAGLHELQRGLAEHFKNLEIIVVDNFSIDATIPALKSGMRGITLIELARKHGIPQALSAGVDAAIGDYVVEIEDFDARVSASTILRLYQECQSGHDFVFLAPRKTRVGSRLFYGILNRHFRSSVKVDVGSCLATICSRRGLNKTASMGAYIVNRNVAYVLTGLSCSTIDEDVRYRNRRGFVQNLSLAIDTFIYYTGIVSSLAVFISIFFLSVSVLAFAYSLVSYFSKVTAEGWVSQILLTSSGFFGVFLMLSIITKYLDHILRRSSNYKNYIHSSLDKR